MPFVVGRHDDNDNEDDNDENDEEYESKIQQALQYFKSKSSQLLKQALQEGGGGRVWAVLVATHS